MRTLLRVPGLIRALLVSCVVLAAVDITLVYLPALGADRGLAAGLIGALLTLRAIASMVSRFFLGRLVKRVGRRRLLVASVALSAVSMGAVALPLPPVAVGALVLLLGLVNMLRGGSANRSQQLMRLRVLLQFVAIVVIMGVIWWRAA